MYQNNPFTEFTLENLRPIRTATGLGYSDIKHIILEYNTNTSAGHPKKIITDNQFVIIGIALSILQIGILLFYILGW